MELNFTLNGRRRSFDVAANTTLLSLLRNEAGCLSVKHGCETGECGACCILLDGKVVNSCILLAAQVDEREVFTLEGFPGWVDYLKRLNVGTDEPAKVSAGPSAFQNPEAFATDQNPAEYDRLHPIQQAFVDTHAIQCGFCTPGMVLSVLALFIGRGLIDWPALNPKRKFRMAMVPPKKKPFPPPTLDEIRDALAGNLCRCTGYVKPIEAAVEAAKRFVESK
ncbi:MAG: (2Fe-2S)-binding protein [Acidobacteriia bacterium]|nr:(2Fe-2S)-binding protein [Terriglobia bacterium]